MWRLPLELTGHFHLVRSNQDRPDNTPRVRCGCASGYPKRETTAYSLHDHTNPFAWENLLNGFNKTEVPSATSSGAPPERTTAERLSVRADRAMSLEGQEAKRPREPPGATPPLSLSPPGVLTGFGDCSMFLSVVFVGFDFPIHFYSHRLRGRSRPHTVKGKHRHT